MTKLFDHPDFDNHERVVFCNDVNSGLQAIIAIHNTILGPSLGGCRMFPYTSESSALTDVLRLSKGMSYKSAITGLPLGGGKSVIIGDPRKDKNRAMLSSMGSCINDVCGRYIVAEDSGTTQQDMAVMREKTCYAAGVEGDPSPYTARGVFQGIKAAVKHRYGRDHLEGIKIGIQGVGNVGYNLAGSLYKEGAILTVSDIYERHAVQAADEFGALIVATDHIIDQEIDVFAPCAMGAVLDRHTIERLRASIVAGAANNQLASEDDGRLLQQRGILYAPDYVINAGGVIAVWYEYSHKNIVTLGNEVDKIYTTLSDIFEQAETQRQPTNDVANQIAELRLVERSEQSLPHRLAM